MNFTISWTQGGFQIFGFCLLEPVVQTPVAIELDRAPLFWGQLADVDVNSSFESLNLMAQAHVDHAILV